MEDQDRIRRISRRLARLCALIMIGVCFSVALYWALADSAAMGWRWLGGIVEPHALTPSVRLMGFAVTLVPVAPVIAGLLYLCRLFGLYGKGVMFGAENVAALRGVGWSCLFFGGGAMLFHPLVALALTAFNPVGQHVITVAVDSGSVVALVLGGVFLVVTWVMDEARKELALTV